MAGTGAELSQTKYRPRSSQCPTFRPRPKCCLDTEPACELWKFFVREKFRHAKDSAAAECRGMLSVQFSLEPRPKQRAAGELAPAGRLFACKWVDSGGRRRRAQLSGDPRV